MDLEEIPTLEAADSIAPKLHPDETSALSRLPPESRRLAFARTWARKEAYLKGLGSGLARRLSSDCVGAGERPSRNLPGWRISDVTTVESHAAAVALRLTP
ncbi:4'-phosphopantetheinyl transferase superfamily protein [Streptomyces lydicus]